MSEPPVIYASATGWRCAYPAHIGETVTDHPRGWVTGGLIPTGETVWTPSVGGLHRPEPVPSVVPARSEPDQRPVEEDRVLDFWGALAACVGGTATLGWLVFAAVVWGPGLLGWAEHQPSELWTDLAMIVAATGWLRLVVWLRTGGPHRHKPVSPLAEAAAGWREPETWTSARRALFVFCPMCDATPQQRCRAGKGTSLLNPHAARIARAEQLWRNP